MFGEGMEPGSAWYKCLNNDDRVLDFFHAVLRLASDNVIEDVEKARPLMRLLFRADEKQSYTVNGEILEKLGCSYEELRRLLISSPGGPRCERVPLPGAPEGALAPILVPNPPDVEPETEEEKAKKGRRRGWSTKEQRLRAIQRGIVTDRGLVNEKGELRPHLLAPMPMLPHFGGHDAAVQRQRMNIHATALAALISRLEWKGEDKKRSKKRAVSDADVPVTVDMGRPKPGLEAFKRPKQMSGPRNGMSGMSGMSGMGNFRPIMPLGPFPPTIMSSLWPHVQGTRVLPPTVYVPGVPGVQQVGRIPLPPRNMPIDTWSDSGSLGSVDSQALNSIMKDLEFIEETLAHERAQPTAVIT